ncbi:MAG: DUF1835 domain-containing protein [Kofleriaceae bacterium]|nr:DUF1835 domain-containing protein [Kofleriaceae bacterium]MBP9206793.1 DUF1835 domain-containing protein [Kofleriaceae bacterium]
MTDRIVHVVNGSVTEQLLAETELPGDLVVWADALDVGPLVVGDAAALRAVRAPFWAGRGRGEAGAIAAAMTRADDAVEAALADATEVVFWYEHDLFDQLALVALLARVAGGRRRDGLALVSIDRHPDVPDFRGFGQLAPHQLAALWPRRVPIARDALDEAAAAWVAVTAADPRACWFVGKRAKALPFLGGALERYLEELPDLATGLSRTERQLLGSVGRGTRAISALEPELRQADPRYPITDEHLAVLLGELTTIGLLAGASPELTLSALGREVLAGAVDRVAKLGITRAHGGIELRGHGPVWRWDSHDRRAVLR